jgi:hypothetical protein
MKPIILSLVFFLGWSSQAMADAPEFHPVDSLSHDNLALHPVSLPIGGMIPTQPLDNIQKTMAIVAVCSLVLSAVSLSYRIAQDQKKD